jgi:hypothetical protein
VIVLQGAIGGSPLADALVHVRPLQRPGLKSLTTQLSRQTFKSAMESITERCARRIGGARWLQSGPSLS